MSVPSIGQAQRNQVQINECTDRLSRDDNISLSVDSPTPKVVLASVCVMLVSWLAAVLTAAAVATLLTVLGRSMTWYSQPLLIIPLYVLPSFLALGEVHAQLLKRVKKLIHTQEFLILTTLYQSFNTDYPLPSSYTYRLTSLKLCWRRPASWLSSSSGVLS